MENNVLTTLAELCLRLRARFNAIDTIVDVFSTMQRAKQVLIFLPDKLEDFGIVRVFIADIRDAFPNAKITFVLRYNYITLLDRNIRDTISTLALRPEHITRFGFPTKQVIATIKKFNFEIALDLNHEFNLLSAHLCFISGAPLRICLSDKKRDPFFNFQVQANKNMKLENIYKNFIRYITLTESSPISA